MIGTLVVACQKQAVALTYDHKTFLTARWCQPVRYSKVQFLGEPAFADQDEAALRFPVIANDGQPRPRYFLNIFLQVMGRDGDLVGNRVLFGRRQRPHSDDDRSLGLALLYQCDRPHTGCGHYSQPSDHQHPAEKAKTFLRVFHDFYRAPIKEKGVPPLYSAGRPLLSCWLS